MDKADTNLTKDWLKKPFLLSGKRVYVAGYRGMVGAALCRRLAKDNCEILTTDRAALDLTQQSAVQKWFSKNKPDIVILAAAKVGGIHANATYPADFLYDNLMIAANVIHAAYEASVQKLLFLGSSCIYPKYAENPIPEDALMTGALEPTNAPYALAKISGIGLCESYRRQYDCDFISAMPCNLYGPGDRFDLQNSHVIPALIMKAHAAKMAGDKILEVWGSGKPRREFLYVDDLANGLLHLLKYYSGSQHINIGAGEDLTIADLAQTICDVIGFEGDLAFNAHYPDGTNRKLMDSSKIMSKGWAPQTSLYEGLKHSYAWYLRHL